MVEDAGAPRARHVALRALSAVGRWLLRLVFAVVLLGVAGAAGAAWWVNEHILTTLPDDLSDLRQFRPPTSSLVYAADGTLVDEFYLERRIWSPLADLPPHVWRAFIAAEDRRYFEHEGFDLAGIFRAAVANFLAGSVTQGGSTITQQLVKNLLVGSERSYERKLKELVLSYRLDQELSKEDILELYVNYVFLGSGNYGVEAAARDYFGVSARALSVGQAALLAGLVPAPSRYSPRTHPAEAAWRREVVLRAMVEEHFIDEAAAQRAIDAPVLEVETQAGKEGPAVAYVTQVRRELRRVLGAELARQRGFHVHTPLDLGLQAVADRAIKSAVQALEDRQGRNGPLARLAAKDWPGFLARAPGLRREARSGAVLPPARGECFQALVGADLDLDRLAAGPYTFALGPDDRAVKVRALRQPQAQIEALAGTSTSGGSSPTPPGPLASTVRAGDVLRVCATVTATAPPPLAVLVTSTTSAPRVRGPRGAPATLDPRPWADGAAVVLESSTGRILAMVGGYDVGLEGFVRATQAQRQPGSSFKPYVYAAALLRGRTQIDTVVDAPLSLPAGGGKVWRPKNYDGKFFGPIPMRDALARNLNTVSVRLALDVGPAEVALLARSMGVRTRLRRDITIALGSSEVTPMDQVLGYATVARLGVTTTPTYVDRLVDTFGNVVGTAGQPVVVDGSPVGELPSGVDGLRALPAGVAYEVADMLRGVVKSGTARKAYRPTLDRAGKTGTTNGYVDAWFVGFTPRHVIAVWIGTDGTFSLGDKETGGRAALPAWIEIADALPAIEGERFVVPDETVLIPWRQDWVGLPRGSVPRSELAVPPLTEAPLPAFGVAPRTPLRRPLVPGATPSSDPGAPTDPEAPHDPEAPPDPTTPATPEVPPAPAAAPTVPPPERPS